MKKKRNVFKPLTGVKAQKKHVASLRHSQSERWLFGVLPADKEAPNIEDEKPSRRLHALFFIFMAVFFVFFGKAFHMQVVSGEESLNLAQQNRFRVLNVRAPRGIFYDRNGTPLVKNIPNYEVTAIPNDLPKEESEREKIYRRLAQTIEMDSSEIKELVEKNGLSYAQPVLVSKSITRETALIFESRQTELRGFCVSINPIREYLDGGLLAHTLGYVGRISEEELEKRPDYMMTDFIGKSGLEREYESILKGTDGKERVEVDSKGEVIRTYGQEDPILGENLMLTVDLELQKKVTEALSRQMKEANVGKATAVAVNPQNGEVLASASLPTYDNNLFAKGISEEEYEKLLKNKNFPLVNRVISGEYPSGSTIKPFLAAAALDRGTITENTKILSTGGIEVGQWSFPDWKRGGHGMTDVFKAIAESVNTFFYAIGGGYQNITGLGPELMKNYLNKFGFGKTVDSDLGSGAAGNLPSPEWKEKYKKESWYLGDSYNMAIGQGDVLVTPLQTTVALSSIANGGTMYKPHIAKAIVDAEGEPKSEKSKEIIESDFVKKQAIEAVRRGMRQAVTVGSARALSDLPVETAGKTGTAEFGPNNAQKHSWFVAFAPYDNPTIAITVLIEGAGEGSDFAAPAAKEILRWYFTR